MSPYSSPFDTKSRKPGLMSVRNFRNLALTAALPLSLLCAGRAEAISTISQTISNQTTSAFTNLPFSTSLNGTANPRRTATTISSFFNKFDTSLGTLVGIRFVGNGDLLGSFRAARSSGNTPLSRLAGGVATLEVTFTDGLTVWNTGNTEGATSFIGSNNIAQSNGTNLGNGSGGTLLTSSNLTLNLSGTDNGTYFSLFEGSAGDTIGANFIWGLNLTSSSISASGACNATTVKCTGFNFSPTGLSTGQTPLRGDINEFTLSYDYQPFKPPTPIPAPLPILGSGVAFAFTRRLRRRIQKACITL
jgi:hypothetical protein